jgi:cell pole-organizing protein PopZ
VKRAGWRDSLFAAISPNYADAAAIVLVAGVRPKEIQNGIQISVIDGNLCVTVKGAKVGKSRGQPERAILLAVDCAAAKHLAELAANGPITVTTKPKSLCEAFRRAGRRAFPRMRLSVSPYSARHALASDLKAAGVDPEGIAQVLGHCATRSQQAYGRGSIRGRSGFSVLGVRASLQAQHIDQSVITQMAFDFTSPEFVSRVTKLTRKKAVASGELAEIKNVQSQIASLNVKINRLMDLIPETTAVEVMLRTVESLEGERESLSKVLNELDREAEAGQLLSNITEKQVAKLLAGIAIDFESQDRESLKDLISNLVDKIEMDPEQLNCWIHYKIPTTTRRWDSVASPRGFEPRSPP